MHKIVSVLCLVIFFCSCDYKQKTKQVAMSPDSSSLPNGVLCTPEITDSLWYSSNKPAPLFSGLGGMHFPISTTNKKAQEFFNQGLMLSYGYNHAEAARSFYEAARQDSSCAMCWWGYAYVLGPNYNGGMEKNNFQRAYNAIQKAKSLSENTTQKEKDLIDALTYRYTNDTTITRPFLDSTYAVKLRNVYQKYPTDVTVASLFAESLMDIHPWNLWKKDGSIQPWTPEIMDVLKKCLRIDPRHAGANHFYIHATEMSYHPEEGEKSADLLQDLVPGSGHLVHMPSHTYIRTGRYHDGVVANQKAVLVDSLYTEACHAQGVYPLAYYPHNYHFLSACAVLGGESKAAIDGAQKTAQHAHLKLLRQPEWATLQHYYSIPWYVEVKLGLWKEILNSSPPEKDLKYPLVIWNYANGMAHLSQNNIEKAKNHLAELKNIMTDTSMKNLSIWGINSVFELCIIASKILEAEIFTKEKNYAAAISLLKEAIQTEDQLNYNEPPDWFFSVRHHLGAVLVEAGQWKDALKVYEEDLKTYPENGWALKGMMLALEKLGSKFNFEKAKLRFEKSWKYADIPITSSRIL